MPFISAPDIVVRDRRDAGAVTEATALATSIGGPPPRRTSEATEPGRGRPAASSDMAGRRPRALLRSPPPQLGGRGQRPRVLISSKGGELVLEEEVCVAERHPCCGGNDRAPGVRQTNPAPSLTRPSCGFLTGSQVGLYLRPPGARVGRQFESFSPSAPAARRTVEARAPSSGGSRENSAVLAEVESDLK